MSIENVHFIDDDAIESLSIKTKVAIIGAGLGDRIRTATALAMVVPPMPLIAEH